jgi:hypothetical protein
MQYRRRDLQDEIVDRDANPNVANKFLTNVLSNPEIRNIKYNSIIGLVKSLLTQHLHICKNVIRCRFVYLKTIS